LNDEAYISLRKDEIIEFRKKVELEGVDIIKKILNDKWFNNIIKDGERVWKNEEEEIYSGYFFPFRWLYEDNEWDFVNTTLGKLYDRCPKKKILRNKFKDVVQDKWMANQCSAFELEVICRLLQDNVLVEIEPKIDKTSNRRADAMINIDDRNILVEISSFQTNIERKLPRIGNAPISKHMHKIQGKIKDKKNHQLNNASIPTVLIITVPSNIMFDQIQAKWAVDEYFKSSDNESISSIIVSDSYLFKYGAWYFNNNSKIILTSKEKEYLSRCIKLNGSLENLYKKEYLI